MTKKTYVLATAVAAAMVPMFALTAFAQTPNTTGGTNAGLHGTARGRSGALGGMMKGRAPGIFGSVTAVSGSTLTVTSTGFGPKATTTVYTVNASKATVKKNGATGTLSDIAVGDKVTIQGTTVGTTVTATAISDGMKGRTGTMKPGVLGNVSAISGSTLTITSKGFGPNKAATTYNVDASSATFDKNGAAATLTDIAVGDMLRIDGTTTGTNVIATAVHDGVGRGNMMKSEEGAESTGTEGAEVGQQPPSIVGNGQPVIMGDVTAVSGTTLTITNKGTVSYSVDDSSAKITKSGNDATTSDVAVGDRVVVQGTVNGTSVAATSVIDQGAPRHAAVTAGGTGTTTHPSRPGFFGHVHDFFAHLFGF